MTLRILLLAANPLDTTRLTLDEESREIREKVRAAIGRDHIDFRTCAAARPDDLLHELNEYRPHVVHFSGHGEGNPGILMSSPSGGSQLVTGPALRRVFTALKDDIRVVLLNACYSSVQAQEIGTVIDFVIGMTFGIDDDAARVFASSFYRALAFGRSVANAFEQGVAAISLHGLPDEDCPTLFVRDGVDAAATLLLTPTVHQSITHAPAAAPLPAPAPAAASSGATTRVQAIPDERRGAPELGFLDYREIYDEQLDQMIGAGGRMAISMAIFNSETRELKNRLRTMSSEELLQMDVTASKQLMNGYAKAMNRMANAINRDYPILATSIDDGVGAMRHMAYLLREMATSRDTLEQNKATVSKFQVALAETHEGIGSFKDSFSALPSMTKELNAARTEATQILERVVQKIADGMRLTGEATTQIDALLADAS